ncbi:MAG: diphthine synthase [Candidatus Aenigmatarchaeota archaeon]
MLSLIGLGIWDERDLSLRGVDACKRADKLYCELYTAAWGGDIAKLEKLVGKKIQVVERSDVEDDSDKLVEEAKTKRIALLAPGDPLTATTHVHLVMECRQKGIDYEVVHASSIYTAIAKSGLQLYKFGRTATVITPAKGYESESFYDALAENHKHGLHTLLLLDVNMGTKQAFDILLAIEKKKKASALKEAVICSALGSENERVIYGRTSDLLDIELPAPAVIIIPGKLHFLEKEFLDTLDKPV